VVVVVFSLSLQNQAQFQCKEREARYVQHLIIILISVYAHANKINYRRLVQLRSRSHCYSSLTLNDFFFARFNKFYSTFNGQNDCLILWSLSHVLVLESSININSRHDLSPHVYAIILDDIFGPLKSLFSRLF
jgi:hypothetical protein